MRVHELAKELGMNSKALVDLMASMKIQVKSHSSSLDETTVDRIRRRVKGQAEPKPVEPARVAKTPSGERILGLRKITPPPPPPEEPAETPAAAAQAQIVEAPGKDALVNAKPAAPEVKGPAHPAAPAQVEQEPPARPPVKPAPPTAAPRVIWKDTRPGMRPAAAAPGTAAPARPPIRPAPHVPPRREAPRPAPPRAPGESPAPAPGAPTPAPTATAPKERPPKIKERIPPPPPPEPVAPPPVVAAEIEVTGPLTVGELASRLGLAGGDVVKRLLEQGIMAGINHQIPPEAAAKVAESFGSTVRKPEAAAAASAAAPKRLQVAKGEAAVSRPPVVTILGHVDHGKTSLLDAIRQTDVAAKEFGGITQHIGASTVDVDGRRIVFIDTPGHEAFTTLRARGAQITDIAVLVVAADDGVMPQTIEALNHAKAAAVPIIAAINKVDLPQANPDRVKQQLSDLGLVPEDWGGDTVTIAVSARTRQGIKELLELILLVSDLQELRADPARPARGTIIEAKLDRGRGPVATVLVQEGTLRVGDAVVAGPIAGRVRAMTNDRGERVTEAIPATPVEVVGLEDVPTAGDLLEVVRDDRMAKAIAQERQERRRAAEAAEGRPAEEAAVTPEGPRELRVIVKADTHGSVEALVASLERLATPEVGVSVLHAGVGNITESDVMLAAASRAKIAGFNIRPEPQVRKVAEQEGIEILTYRVIYEAIDDMTKRVRGLMAPKRREVSLGQAEVRKTFTISKVGVVAGCYVGAGVIPRSAMIRVIRDGVVVHEGKISSLRRFKDDVREVTEGFECGIGLERFGDVKVGDILEAFEIREEPA